jgi:1-acyl-sn-glycerol-3-phosphate acyltransferase
LNATPRTREQNTPVECSWLDRLRFATGLLFNLAYWLLFLPPLVLLGMIVGLFSGPTSQAALGKRLISYLVAGLMRGFIILGIVRIDDRELRALANRSGPVILVANHPALWDAFLLLRHFRQTTCIMKAELRNNPLYSGASKFAGFVPNTPRLVMIREAVRHLKGGGQLLVFPEGTRTRPENLPLNPFRPGFAVIAKASNAPVQPLFIETENPYLQKDWPFWKCPPLPVRITIRPGEEERWSSEETARSFSQRIEKQFRDKLARH